MQSTRIFLLAVGLIATIAASPVWAAAVQLNEWYEFVFRGGAGAVAEACIPGQCTVGAILAPNPPWTFTTTDPVASLAVTDGFNYGDRFQIFDFGQLLGETDTFGLQNGGCGSSPDVCLSDPLSSSGTFLLAPGSHEITISTLVSPSGGAAFFRVNHAAPEPDPVSIPEPASSLLLLASSLWLAGLRQRHRMRRMASEAATALSFRRRSLLWAARRMDSAL